MKQIAGGPIHGQERIFSIDVLRGIAIAGIFFVNMHVYAFPAFYGDPISYVKSKTDGFVYGAIDILAQASFYPLFAFLFGYGLAIMKERIDARGQSFIKIALRRMALLLGFGVIHAFFIWSGDILIIYALFGILLIFILQTKASPKTLAIIAGLLYMIPNSLLILLYHFLFKFGFLTRSDLYDPVMADETIAIYRYGSFQEITEQRIFEWFYVNVDGAFILFFMVFPILVFGVSFARSGMLTPDRDKRKFFRNGLLISLPVGLLCKLTPYLFPENIALELFQDLIGGPILTCAYIALIYLLSDSTNMRKVLVPFSKVGRMSLSNYILQSIICTFLFYSFGFKLFGTISYTIGAFIVIGIFSVQLFASHLWFKSFRIGPLEWVWRWGTYGRKPQLKINKEMMSR